MWAKQMLIFLGENFPFQRNLIFRILLIILVVLGDQNWRKFIKGWKVIWKRWKINFQSQNWTPKFKFSSSKILSAKRKVFHSTKNLHAINISHFIYGNNVPATLYDVIRTALFK
jgi:hypothetical protein